MVKTDNCGRTYCIGILNCGKSEQNPASCYYLLVVKVKGLLLRLGY